MKPNKKTQPKFKHGDTVYVSILEKDCIVKGEPDWNGFVWMYRFIGEAMRAGEGYLTKRKSEQVPA